MRKHRVAMRALLLAGVVLAAVLLGTVGGAYAANLFTMPLSGSIKIVPKASYDYYADREATVPLANVTLGDLTRGGNETFTFYLKNTSGWPEMLSAGPSGLPESVGTLKLTFDGKERSTLAADAVARVDGRLQVRDSAEPGSLNFALSIDATPIIPD